MNRGANPLFSTKIEKFVEKKRFARAQIAQCEQNIGKLSRKSDLLVVCVL